MWGDEGNVLGVAGDMLGQMEGSVSGAESVEGSWGERGKWSVYKGKSVEGAKWGRLEGRVYRFGV